MLGSGRLFAISFAEKCKGGPPLAPGRFGAVIASSRNKIDLAKEISPSTRSHAWSRERSKRDLTLSSRVLGNIPPTLEIVDPPVGSWRQDGVQPRGLGSRSYTGRRSLQSTGSGARPQGSKSHPPHILPGDGAAPYLSSLAVKQGP